MTEAMLARLSKRFPRFDPQSTPLKAVAVNALYHTHVLAIERIAAHVSFVLRSVDVPKGSPDLVERLAYPGPRSKGESKQRRNLSFASKFAHFFIDSDRFPIFDNRVRVMLAVHLGRGMVRNTEHPYVGFLANLSEFRQRFEWTGKARDLDRYLWLAESIRAPRACPEITYPLMFIAAPCAA